ncbi:hypothetical protein [Bifidobacterium aquikefiricola]|uniref:Uncharacterized protein n=1 Tax=Bifidobacterium aquikefiricola TaxID=3059038 RepID=A0AB39U4D9_9BIFI
MHAGSSSTLTDRVRVKLLGACGKDVYDGGAENKNLDSNCDRMMDTFHFAVETRLTIGGQSRTKFLNYRGYYRGGSTCDTTVRTVSGGGGIIRVYIPSPVSAWDI